MVEMEAQGSPTALGQSHGQSPPTTYPSSARETGRGGAWVCMWGSLGGGWAEAGFPFPPAQRPQFTLFFLQATLRVRGAVCLVTG